MTDISCQLPCFFQAMMNALTNVSDKNIRQPTQRKEMSGILNRQHSENCHEKRVESITEAKGTWDQNSEMFSSFIESKTSMLYNSSCDGGCSIFKKCCTMKSQFWRRHLYQHWLQKRKPLQFHTKVFNVLLLVVMCLLSKFTLCQADNAEGNILTNLNNDRNSDTVRPQCKMSVPECELLPNRTTCFGVKLPYSYSTTQLATDSKNQDEVQKNLLLWQGKYFPIRAYYLFVRYQNELIKIYSITVDCFYDTVLPF